MGKMALLMVVAVALSVGIVGYTLNKSKMNLTTRVAGFEKYTYARNIAHSAVNMTLRAFDRNDTTVIYPLERKQTVTLDRSMMGGTSTVIVKLVSALTRDTLDLFSRAVYNDSSYYMRLRLRRGPKPFPGVGACVGFASAGIDYNVDGKPHFITGMNYNMDGTRGDMARDTFGVCTKTVLDSIEVATEDYSRISGDPRGIAAIPPDNPAAYINEYIAMADFVYPNGSNNNGNYGSKYAPVIGFANGSVKFGGGGTFYGVLIVNGTLEFSGNFTIYGLVLCYGSDIVISVSTSAGTPSLYGGLIMYGAPGSDFTLKGTPNFYYSYEALQMAMYIGKMQAYQVLEWYYQ